MSQRQSMPMMQNGLIGGMQQQAPKNVLNVGGAPKQTLQYESEPLRGGIGSLGSDSISGQFGQMGSGQYGNASSKSLEQVLAERGFEMPEMPTGMQNAMQSMFKDPITGEYRTGGQHAANHANAMSKFYGQNPEALEIAKQYNTNPTQFGDKPSPTTSLQQEMPKPFGNQPQQVQGPTLNPAQLQQEQINLSNAQASAVGMPTAAPLPPVTSLPASQMQQPQPQQPQMQQMQQPQMQPPPSPMQQPQYSQQDMQGMMGLMIQMFQKAMQNSGGQNSYNAGFFGGNNMQFQQPQYAPPPPQPMTGRQRFLKNSGNSPFGQY